MHYVFECTACWKTCWVRMICDVLQIEHFVLTDHSSMLSSNRQVLSDHPICPMRDIILGSWQDSFAINSLNSVYHTSGVHVKDVVLLSLEGGRTPTLRKKPLPHIENPRLNFFYETTNCIYPAPPKNWNWANPHL